MDTIKSTHTAFLDKPPCCLKFFPHSRNNFVVGTYNLLDYDSSDHKQNENTSSSGGADQSAETQRNGSLEIFELTSNRIIHVDSLNVEYGILDIHFHEDLLGVATSIGLLALFKVVKSESKEPPQLVRLGSIKVADSSVVVTSFAWMSSTTSGPQAIISLTSGSVEIVTIPQHALEPAHIQAEKDTTSDSLVDTSEPTQIPLFKHSLEAWIVATRHSVSNSTQVFSGGDDAVLACSSLDIPPATTLWSDRRSHTAGVTAIFLLPDRLTFRNPMTPASNESELYSYSILFTGSYDDKLRVMYQDDPQSLQRPRVLHELDIGGGVWRIELLNFFRLSEKSNEAVEFDAQERYPCVATLLISAMYAGAFVVRVVFEHDVSWLSQDTPRENLRIEDVATVRSEIVAHFAEHESMCYCAEAAPLALESQSRFASPTSQEKRQIVSCSFYDKRVCLWEWGDAEQATDVT